MCMGMPSKDTVKLSDDDGFVNDSGTETVSGRYRRRRFFSIRWSRSLHESIQKDMSRITDDAMVVEQETVG